MGCECLGPKRSQQEVYVKLMKQIYQDAKKISAAQLSKHDTYTVLHQKIIKKGELRKLVDNLSSRKHKIRDAFILNSKLLSQSKELVDMCCGLMIVNSISQIVYPNQQPINIDLSIKDDLSSNVSNNSFIKKNSSKFTSVTFTDKNSSKNHHHPQYQSSNLEVDELYFKTIKYLYQSDQKIRKRVVESVNSYCRRHFGFLTCQAEVWKFIRLIMEDIKNNIDPDIKCMAFKNLLSRTRDQLNQQIKDREIFQSLLLVWLRAQKNQDEQGVIQSCFQIFHIYLVRFMSAWESQFLYEALFRTYDKLQFEKVSSLQLEKLFQDLVDKTEYHKNFQRSLFNYLLGYLSLTQQNYVIRKSLISSLGIKLQNHKTHYTNAIKPHIKVQCLKKMNSWIDKSYIDIDQFCIYNSKGIINVYVLTLVPFQQYKFPTELILQQFNITLTKLSAQTINRMIQTAIQELYSLQISQRQQLQILVLIRQMTEKYCKNNKYLRYQCYFMPLLVQLKHNKKRNIIKLGRYLLSKVQKALIDQQTSQKIIQLLCSFYKNIVVQNQDINQKYQLVSIFLQYIRDLYPLVKKNIISAYYRFMSKQYNDNIKKITIQTQFCLLIYIFTLRTIITTKQLPQNLQKLKKIVQQKPNKNECLSQINKYFFAKDDIKIDTNTQQQKSKINQKQFEQYEKMYKNCLANREIHHNDFSDKKQTISKKNSMLSGNQENSNQSHGSSFQDVISFIHQK